MAEDEHDTGGRISCSRRLSRPGPAGLVRALRRGLAPAHDRCYPKWVGVVLGLLLAGSAHFFSGRKRVGIVWCLTILLCALTWTGLIAVPGDGATAVAGFFSICVIALYVVMLVQSYRPVRRIGWHGWLALIIMVLCLRGVVRSVSRLAVHPFRISSNTMAPTILGMRTVTVDSSVHPSNRLLDRYLKDRRYIRWETSASGTLTGPHYSQEALPLWGYRVGSDTEWLPRSAERHLKLGREVAVGELLFSGYLVGGDQLLVEKVSYKFRTPRRGEIVVFRTDGIRDLVPGEFYILRIVGLPGERVQIDPPYLVVDGQRVTEPPIFRRIASQEEGYSGYQLAENPERRMFLDTTESEAVLGEGEYFVLGDDAKSAYDSRMWGPVPRENIIGRVTRIYWPLDRLGALEGKW